MICKSSERCFPCCIATTGEYDEKNFLPVQLRLIFFFFTFARHVLWLLVCLPHHPRVGKKSKLLSAFLWSAQQGSGRDGWLWNPGVLDAMFGAAPCVNSKDNRRRTHQALGCNKWLCQV